MGIALLYPSYKPFILALCPRPLATIRIHLCKGMPLICCQLVTPLPIFNQIPRK